MQLQIHENHVIKFGPYSTHEVIETSDKYGAGQQLKQKTVIIFIQRNGRNRTDRPREAIHTLT
ncbi:hypothetical protein JV46_24340 [Solemya velum gill symbiont]|uniref:Uncharacterized protein n=1 Tax=Solemya velum gill symbiont TaxID=2340 RepID=A0A0B0H8P4_SOVGS|nr:hypothetical protein [Solemya velum gill symbiont]KHF24234.1 hypothetical protein JV46_24340 [Solemya velum gill symbiont]